MVSSISSNYDYYQQNVQSNFNQLQQDFKDLASALQSGNLAAAQQAFSALQNLQTGSQTQSRQNGTNSNSTLSTDFDALGKALQSGDLTAAQDAFAKLKQDIQSTHRGHHHHIHNNVSGKQSQSSTVISAAEFGLTRSTNADSDNISASGSSINVSA